MSPEQYRKAAVLGWKAYTDHYATCEAACARSGQCREAYLLMVDAGALAHQSMLAAGLYAEMAA